MRRSWMLAMAMILALGLGACAGTGADRPDQGVPTGTMEVGGAASMTGTDTSGAGETAGQGQVDCTAVLCAACPEGQTPLLRSPNCCQCVPIDRSINDCSNVRCAECPEGQRPALRPPDCCRCIPDRGQ